MFWKRYKVIVDTNIITSGLISNTGASHKILKLILKGSRKFKIQISNPLLLEYEKSIKDNTNLSEEDVEIYLKDISNEAKKHRIFFLWRPFLKDFSDDKVIEIAIKSNAEYIITFNSRDFYNVPGNFNIKIITPGDFLDLIGE